jgi:hypothetical protein
MASFGGNKFAAADGADVLGLFMRIEQRVELEDTRVYPHDVGADSPFHYLLRV